MREIHSLEDIYETIEERAKPKFGYRVEIGERVHAAKKNCGGFGVVVQQDLAAGAVVVSRETNRLAKFPSSRMPDFR